MDIRFKVSHACPFGNISRKYPSLKMFEWCNREHEVLEIVLSDRKDYHDIMNEIKAATEIVSALSDGDRVHIITKICTCAQPGSVSRHLDDLNILQLDPVVYEQGWEHFRIIAFNNEAVSELMKRMKDEGFLVEITLKKPFKGSITRALSLTADALFSNLTEKQMDALVTAYIQGYFSYPRRTDVQTMAARMHVPRTTFVEHLKKAENKVVIGLIPYIQIFRSAVAAAAEDA